MDTPTAITTTATQITGRSASHSAGVGAVGAGAAAGMVGVAAGMAAMVAAAMVPAVITEDRRENLPQSLRILSTSMPPLRDGFDANRII